MNEQIIKAIMSDHPIPLADIDAFLLSTLDDLHYGLSCHLFDMGECEELNDYKRLAFDQLCILAAKAIIARYRAMDLCNG